MVFLNFCRQLLVKEVQNLTWLCLVYSADERQRTEDFEDID